jgi:hypothetical protein
LCDHVEIVGYVKLEAETRNRPPKTNYMLPHRKWPKHSPVAVLECRIAKSFVTVRISEGTPADGIHIRNCAGKREELTGSEFFQILDLLMIDYEEEALEIYFIDRVAAADFDDVVRCIAIVRNRSGNVDDRKKQPQTFGNIARSSDSPAIGAGEEKYRPPLSDMAKFAGSI